MPRLQRKSFAGPDQVRRFEHGLLELVQLDETTVGRFIFQPGWRWSRDIAPIVGTKTCQNRHVGYVLSGTIHVVMDEGTELNVGAGDAYEIRAGLHTGEVEVVGGQPRGVAVHAAARVAALAGAGEVFVSATTRDLLDGSGLTFEDRGVHDEGPLGRSFDLRPGSRLRTVRRRRPRLGASRSIRPPHRGPNGPWARPRGRLWSSSDKDPGRPAPMLP